MSKISKILVMQPWGLGDVILSISLLHSIRKCFPRAEITLLLQNREMAKLLKYNGLIDYYEIINHKFGFLAKMILFLRLRSKNYDASVSAYGISKHYSTLAKFLSGCPPLRTPTVTTRSLSNTTDDMNSARHRFIENMNVIGSIYDFDSSVSISSISTKLRLPAIGYDLVEHIIHSRAESGKYIVLHLGSGGQDEKRIPIKLAVRLITSIKQAYPSFVVCYLAGANDPEYSSLPNDLRKLMLDMPRSSLIQISHVLQRSSLVISGDTGVSHLANAVGANVIVIAGPTNIETTHPWGQSNNVVVTRNPPSCMPCYGTSLFNKCPYNVRCLTEIDSNDLMLKVDTILKVTSREGLNKSG